MRAPSRPGLFKSGIVFAMRFLGGAFGI